MLAAALGAAGAGSRLACANAQDNFGQPVRSLVFQTEASFSEPGPITVWAQFSDHTAGTYDPSVGTVASLEAFVPLCDFQVRNARSCCMGARCEYLRRGTQVLEGRAGWDETGKGDEVLGDDLHDGMMVRRLRRARAHTHIHTHSHCLSCCCVTDRARMCVAQMEDLSPGMQLAVEHDAFIDHRGVVYCPRAQFLAAAPATHRFQLRLAAATAMLLNAQQPQVRQPRPASVCSVCGCAHTHASPRAARQRWYRPL